MSLTRRELLSQSLSAVAVGSMPLSASAVGQRRIALTFDDVPRDRGAFFPTGERTERLIATLRTWGVEQAAFFAVPGFIEEPGKANGPAHMAAYVAAGHVIANHTWDHPRLSDISAAQFIGNIAQAESWLKGRPGYRPWFRFPYLDQAYAQPEKSRKVAAYLRQVGLANAWVTIDGSDWALEDEARVAAHRRQRIDRAALRSRYVRTMIGAAEFYDRLAVSLIGRSPSHVMLLHETDVAALYIGDFIRELHRGGWTVISADEAYADPLYRTLPLGPASDFCKRNGPCPNAAAMGHPLATGPTVFELMAWAAGRRGETRYVGPKR